MEKQLKEFSHVNLGTIPQQPGASSVAESSLDHGSVDLQFDFRNTDGDKSGGGTVSSIEDAGLTEEEGSVFTNPR